MITRVHIKNYRSLENVEVELGRLTVLVGRNGAGKSNFVDALKFVQEALAINLEAAVANRNGLSSLMRWTAKPGPMEIEISARRGNFSGTYSLALASTPDADFRVKREACTVHFAGESPVSDGFEILDGVWVTRPRDLDTLNSTGDHSQGIESAKRQLNLDSLFLPATRIMTSSPLGQMLTTLRGSSFFSLYPNTMREPQKFSTTRQMGDHGENFSAALRHMKDQWDESREGPFMDLLAALRRVVDDISDVQVKQVGGYLVTEVRHEYQRECLPGGDREARPWFDISQESDGTMRMLGLLIGLYQVRTSCVLVSVEEPEVHIHPGALAVLADVLQDVSGRRQLLLTTQSPDLISRLPVDDLRIVERRQGSTRIGKIADSQRKAVEQQLFTTGDLMRIEGLYSSEEANAEYA